MPASCACRPRRSGNMRRAAARGRRGGVPGRALPDAGRHPELCLVRQPRARRISSCSRSGALKPNPRPARHAGQRRRDRARTLPAQQGPRLHGQAGGLRSRAETTRRRKTRPLGPSRGDDPVRRQRPAPGRPSVPPGAGGAGDPVARRASRRRKRPGRRCPSPRRCAPAMSPKAIPWPSFRTIIKATTDADIRSRLAALQREYAKRIDEEANLRGRAARSLLRLAAFLGDKLRADRRFLDQVQKSRDTQKEAGVNVRGARYAAARNSTATLQGTCAITLTLSCRSPRISTIPPSTSSSAP